jgi:FMN phosphatase YigB (HAD superfamily)
MGAAGGRRFDPGRRRLARSGRRREQAMLAAGEVVFLLDVDNTLFDNDRFAADLGARLDVSFGKAERERYWAIYQELREEFGFADYLGAMQKFRVGLDDDSDLLQLAAFILDYPFAKHLYPRALEAIAHLQTLGLPAILSDGDIVVQPRKIQHAGIWDAVKGNVLVYMHKERMLDSMQRRFPAAHYVIVDDKPNLLAAMKRILGAKMTGVFVRQGHYAAEAGGKQIDPAPDCIIERIGDLLDCDLPFFLTAAPTRPSSLSLESR